MCMRGFTAALSLARFDILVPLICLALSTSLCASESTRPNIVFIMADDLGWGDVGFHGGAASTPNLDHLAEHGIELTHHYVAPVCSPTRTGLLTGRCWSRFGVTTPTNTLAIPHSTLTLPRLLSDAGYETCLIGKWHLGSLPKWGPNHFGFDHSYGSLAGGVSPWSHGYKQGPYRPTWHRNETLVRESGHVTDLLTREAEQWISKRSEKPFFLYLPYTAVHLPLREPDEWVARVSDSVEGPVERHYLASIMHLDDAVGKIVRALESAELLENTIVIFTSDNGGSTAENNDLRYPDDDCPNGALPGQNLPLRGKKGDVYEGGIRVPTIVSCPKLFSPRKEDTPVQIIDWLPTIGRFAEVKIRESESVDGFDLSDLLLHQREIPDRSIYTVGPNWRSVSLRDRRWKLIQHQNGESVVRELYDLINDSQERHDVASQHPEVVSRLRLNLVETAMSDRDSVVDLKGE